MEAVKLRPKLVSFRATSFHGENKDAADASKQWTLQLTQTIEVGLAATQGRAVLAIVKIDLVARALQEGAPEETADFSGKYEAKFAYSPEVQESEIVSVLGEEPYQYLLVAQAFPLAMTHFRREMQAMGFDARELPLGI